MDPIREQKILALLADDPSIILMFKYDSTTENMWKTAIENEPSLFQNMRNPSQEMVMYALSQDGANLRYLERMGIDVTPDIIYTAVDSYPGAIFMIPESLWSTRLKEFACSKDNSLMKEIPVSRSYVEAQLKKDPTLVRFLKDPTEEQLCAAIKANPSVCAYIEHYTPRMARMIQDNYPGLISLIPKLKELLSELNDA